MPSEDSRVSTKELRQKRTARGAHTSCCRQVRSHPFAGAHNFFAVRCSAVSLSAFCGRNSLAHGSSLCSFHSSSCACRGAGCWCAAEFCSSRARSCGGNENGTLQPCLSWENYVYTGAQEGRLKKGEAKGDSAVRSSSATRPKPQRLPRGRVAELPLIGRRDHLQTCRLATRHWASGRR